MKSLFKKKQIRKNEIMPILGGVNYTPTYVSTFDIVNGEIVNDSAPDPVNMAPA